MSIFLTIALNMAHIKIRSKVDKITAETLVKTPIIIKTPNKNSIYGNIIAAGLIKNEGNIL